MKQLVFLLKSICMAGAFALVFTGCSKDDNEDDDSLIGRWVYSDANMKFSYDGQWYDAKEEGMDISSELTLFHGMYFVFDKNGTVVIGVNGQSGSAKYGISGDELIIDGISMGQYHLSGNTLELVWTSSYMHGTMGFDDSELYDMGIDDYEFILTFTRRN